MQHYILWHSESLSSENRIVIDDPRTILPLAGRTTLMTVELVLRKITELSGTCVECGEVKTQEESVGWRLNYSYVFTSHFHISVEKCSYCQCPCHNTIIIHQLQKLTVLPYRCERGDFAAAWKSVEPPIRGVVPVAVFGPEKVIAYYYLDHQGGKNQCETLHYEAVLWKL